MGRVWVPLIIYPLVGVEKNELKKNYLIKIGILFSCFGIY
jgi:hypothetical protein